MAIEGSGEGVVDSGAASGAAAGSGGSAGSTGAAGSVGAAGAGNPTPTPKWEDDPRAKGLLADIQRERKARQDYERKVTEAETRAAERDRQIAALTGAKTPSKEEADADAVRERFAQLYPGLAKLTDANIEKILQAAERGDQLEETTNNYWTNHGRTMLNSVHTALGKELGDLTDRQKARINAAYVQEAQADPEFMQRHTAGDPKLVEEFVKNYLEDFVEPVRRKMTQTEVSRQRPVPFGKDRSIPGDGGKKIDVNDSKAVMDFIMESRKGKFGR